MASRCREAVHRESQRLSDLSLPERRWAFVLWGRIAGEIGRAEFRLDGIGLDLLRCG
jgi:hypothetical protein